MNWFPLMNIIIAQKKLKENNVKDSPKELILGLFPGFQSSPVTQLITTNAVVNNAITTKEKEEVATKKAEVDLRNTELANALVDIGANSLTIGADGKVADNDALKRLKDFTTRFPHIKKKFLDSPQVNPAIKEKLVQTAAINVTGANENPQTVRHTGARLRHSNN